VLAEQLGNEQLEQRHRKQHSESCVAFPNAGEQRFVAVELANLYERARYAPEADGLPEEAFARARRDLCRFAGVSPS
jgi:hypothetical protein